MHGSSKRKTVHHVHHVPSLDGAEFVCSVLVLRFMFGERVCRSLIWVFMRIYAIFLFLLSSCVFKGQELKSNTYGLKIWFYEKLLKEPVCVFCVWVNFT